LYTFTSAKGINPLQIAEIMNIQKTVAKKANIEIKQIMNANNMVSVESLINTALLKSFGLINLGCIKYAMINNKDGLLKAYGYSGNSRNFELLKAVRNHNFDLYALDAKKYLISFIPERMKVSEMYKRLVN
jgi:hypothetical protein